MCTHTLHHVNAQRCCQSTCSSSYQILCETAIIFFTGSPWAPGSARRGLFSWSVHTSGSSGVVGLQFLAADNERELSGLSGGSSRGLPGGDRTLQRQQKCPFSQGNSTFHSGVNTFMSERSSPVPFSTNISRNFYFQEMYPPGIPGGLHFHCAWNYWKMCSDLNCGEWRDQTQKSWGLSWICFGVRSTFSRAKWETPCCPAGHLPKILTFGPHSPSTAQWGLDTLAAAWTWSA